MEGMSNVFSSSTLAEGMGLIAGIAELAGSIQDPELLAMEAELKALKEEVNIATSGLTEAAWDDVGDDDLRFILQVEAGVLGRGWVLLSYCY